MADVTQTDDADHALALVHDRQPADLQFLHVRHRLCEVIVLSATSLTLMADLRSWSVQLDAMQHSPRFLNYTSDRVRWH